MKQHHEAFFTDHALFEMGRRSLSLDEVYEVFHDPDQLLDISEERWIHQKKFDAGVGQKPYLIRVFVDKKKTGPEIVTAYRTSKIEKYWLEDA